MNQFKNLVVFNSLKYDASDMSEAENEIRYWIVCCVVIVDDSVWTEMSAENVSECIEDVLNDSWFLLVDFLLISLSELAQEWDVFI